MRARRVFSAVDSHTEGMPTRVITGGFGIIPGATMAERRLHFIEHLDDLRTLLMLEPRGHSAMSGAILQPPTRPDADWGVLYIEVSGLLPMCGHGTIGVATVLVETGMVTVEEPVTTIRLDTPAGLVTVEVEVEDGRAKHVTLTNVPAFVHALDELVHVPGLGDIRYDMAYGGNFYALLPVERLGLDLDVATRDELISRGLRLMDAINEQAQPVHPVDPAIRGCKHVVAYVEGVDGADARAATLIHPGWFDRSPCGTGTSARLAQLHARGEIKVGDSFVNESWIGSRFTGIVLEETEVADRPAIIPQIRGRAWITALAHYVLDPDDPFPAGFAV
jgi:proline racemase